MGNPGIRDGSLHRDQGPQGDEGRQPLKHSFPGSAWERTPASLCLPSPRGEMTRRRSLKARRSQEDPGNEETFFGRGVMNRYLYATLLVVTFTPATLFAAKVKVWNQNTPGSYDKAQLKQVI